MALRAEQLNCFCNDNAISGVRVSPFGYLRIVSIWSECNRCETAGFDALARLPLRDHERARSTAHQFIQLRQEYPEMSRGGTFRSVQAALTDSRKSSEGERAAPSKRQYNPAYPVPAEDLWDWERGEESTRARRRLSGLCRILPARWC